MAIDLHPLYSIPLPQPSFRPSNLKQSRSSQKRKRDGRVRGAGQESGQLDESHQESIAAEYTSIITPLERTQRRLAGQVLNEQPPKFPFPHTQSTLSRYDQHPEHNGKTGAEPDREAASSSHSSLKEQHIATIVALLHRFLDLRDYNRASRAFALLLRTEVSGNTIDLRYCGLWTVGAELLLYPNTRQKMNSVSRDAFERVKTYYNRLALQNPWQRRRSSIIDAQEFKSAMFSFWIYTVCAESRRMQNTDNLDDSDLSLLSYRVTIEAKQWELDEARKIAKELDSLMNTIPFVDNLELLRLRAMVAWWQADLLETVEQLRTDFESTNSAQEYDTQSLAVGEPHIDGDSVIRSFQGNQGSKEAGDARDFAATIWARLGYQEENHDEVEDNWES